MSICLFSENSTGDKMTFLNDFQSELISQTSIVHYIEYQFEQELSRAKRFLNIETLEDLYTDNSNYMKRLNWTCDNLLDKNAQSYLKEKTLPDIAQNVDIREPIGEVIQYCVETLEDGDYLDVPGLKEELAEIDITNGVDYRLYEFTEEQIKQIIESAYIIKDYRFNAKLEEQDEIINSLKTTIKLVDNSSSSNIFRQSFINVFSIFDAYVFEHLKKYFYENPNELEKFLDNKNSEKVKLTLEETLVFHNISDLKIYMVEKSFAGRYLSELIGKLNKYKPNIFMNVDYPLLMEMIERRNIHLHNKGFADSKYCNSFNIYKLNIGDYAYIDSEYLFIKMFNTLSQFITNIEKELTIYQETDK